jgi:glycosyltransferase involved in cell wall biosynthesis
MRARAASADSSAADLSIQDAPAAPAIAERDTPIRVLWLIKGLGSGGAERLLCLLAEERNRKDFRYEAAYLLRARSELLGELERAEIPVHCLDAGRHLSLGWAARLRRLLLANRYDVLHFHSPYPAAIARLVVRSLPRAARPLLISTEHVTWWGYARTTRLINALTYPLDDAHITVSRAVHDSIPALLRRRRHDVVVHGVPLERVREELAHRDAMRRELGVDDDEVLVGTIANMRTQKAYPDLMKAARQVLDGGANVRFVAVGRGQLEDEIRGKHSALGLGDRFLLLGYREDAARVLGACDLFVLASLFEGLPVSLMEALALGVPVVATAVGGVPELITEGEEGLLVPPSRPDLLAAAIEKLVGDPRLRLRMAEAARRRSAAVDVRRAARDIEEMYIELITG